MKRISTYLLMFLMLMGVSSKAQDLVITGIVDGPLAGGLPKAIEVYVLADIADLSIYALESANNGNVPAGPEFTFPADAANEGDYIYVAQDDASNGFLAFFGFAPNYINNVANNNGDDVILLYQDGNIVDVLGEPGVDGTGTTWESSDGWVYRNDGTGPDGDTFVEGNWTYSGIEALTGETTNATAANPWPIGTYSPGASNTVATPVISPASGDYFSAISVSMTCGTSGATIRYTTNGTDPTPSSTVYSAPFNVSTTTTVKARAYKAGMTESSIATRQYNFPTVTNIANIGQLRTQTVGNYYKLTGQAILTFQQTYRGQKFIQDATGAILIDDLAGVITTTYNLNDGITNITGTLSEFGGMMQFVPALNPGAATSSGNTVTPQVVTLSTLTSNFETYESELVKVVGAVFTDAGTNFANGTVYVITDGSTPNYNFRTTFYDVDYIGTPIPSGAQDLILIPNSRTDGNFVTSRSDADINPSSSANPAVKLDITEINSGNPVYEYQPFTVKVQSLDVNNVPANVTSNTTVTLTVGTGTGTLGGTLTGVIASGTNTVTISGVTYGPHQNNVILNVNGGSLTQGNSNPFNVLEVVIADLVITEVMYHAMPGEDTLEYIELYNNGSSSINLENYTFTQGVELIFPSTNLTAGSYLLIAKNSSAIQDAFGVSSIQWTSGGLVNSGEDIEITDDNGSVVAFIDFLPGAPWPADIVGKSIRFCNPDLPNNVAANWSSSDELIATIGGQDIFGSPLEGCGAEPLVANFSGNPVTLDMGGNVDFTDLSTGTPTGWSWSFQGGTPSTLAVQNPQNIVYNTAGTYNVTLTITRGGDSDTETKVGYITVNDPTEPPVADFEANPTTLYVGQSVSFTDLSLNNPTSFAWTFEGGTPGTSDAQNPTITYNTAGTYNVTLSVENNAGSDELMRTDYITVLPAVEADLIITEIMYHAMPGEDTLEYFEIYNNGSTAINLENYTITQGVELVFTSTNLAAGSYLLVAKNSSAIQDAFGVSSVQWTSGGLNNDDDIIEINNPTGDVVAFVEYFDASPWPTDQIGKSIRFCNIALPNNDPANWSISNELLATIGGQDIYGTPLEGCGADPLIADFVGNPLELDMGASVDFTDLSSGIPTGWNWSFQGGTPASSTAQNPQNIVYSNAGTFNVTLTVTRGGDSDAETKVGYISVNDPTQPPIADFEADMNLLFVGQSVHFTDLSQNAPTSYQWTFEGGSPASSTVQNPTVTYNTPGTYDVTLFVQNSAGTDELIRTDYITVLPATVGDLVITEIMYNSPESGNDSLEYIEIYNNSDNEVNLFGYSFTSGVEYVFPQIVLENGNYLLVAIDSVALLNTLGVTAYQWTSGALSNSGELLKLSSPLGETVDSIPYQNVAPWPLEANGGGSSMTICDPETENSIGDAWHASVNFLAVNATGDSIFGSPGTDPEPIANLQANDILPGVGDQVEFTELSICNATSFSWVFEGGNPSTSVEPNPTVTYEMAGDFDVTLTVSNATGSHSLTLTNYIQVGVGIVEQHLSQIEVMPNPSNGLYKLTNPSQQEISVRIYNVVGQSVYEIKTVDSEVNIDLTLEENGIYMLQILMGSHHKTLRIVKQ